MKLTEIQIDHYGPLPRFSHECTENFEVFYGPNESGKTLLLEAILQLLAPDIEAAIGAVSRVQESPSGFVVVEINGTERQLGNDDELTDFVAITPQHLRNIFVIRDSDLALRNEHEFYDSVTQQIGDLHTTEIAAIQSSLVDSGRLTSLRGRKLSAADGNDNAGDVRDSASELQTDLHDYIQDAEANEIASAEREIIAVSAELQQCQAELDVQNAAETWDRYETLSERLSMYRDAVTELDDRISATTLSELERLTREIDALDDSVTDLESKRAALRRELTQLESEKESVEAELSSLESRETDLSEVERALESYRDTNTDSMVVPHGMRFARYVTLVGLGAGGLAAVGGSTSVAIALTVIASGAALWYGLQYRSLKAAEQGRQQTIQRAQDAGFDVEKIEDIAPAIQSFRDEFQRLQKRRDTIQHNSTVKSELIENCTDELKDERRTRREKHDEKQHHLQEGGVTDVAAYRERVRRQEELERQRGRAEQSLTDALRVPAGANVDDSTKIRYWNAELDALIRDLDDTVSATDYNPEYYDSLRDTHQRLTRRQEELTEQLTAHEQRLREFDDRIQALPTHLFVEPAVTLSSRTLEGLRELHRELDRVIDQIERDADIAREALDIFDDIQAVEEQKITDLFGEDSRATDVFSSLTNNRYSNVTYDTTEKVLNVHRDGSDVLTPTQLSHGTTEQLYLSARIGLAEQLLNAEPGFFLLDDAFLPADRTRLQEGFEVLQTLAENGWQILYFTAKHEVGHELVTNHEIECRTFDSLI